MTVLLFRRLYARRWDTTLLQRIFNDTSEKVKKKCPLRKQGRRVNPQNGQNRIFINTKYHPNGIPRKINPTS